MSNRGSLAQNHGGSGTQAVSQIFTNSRKRLKYKGRRGELVADLCECEGTAKLYLHDGVKCGGIPVSAIACGGTADEVDICALMANAPDLGTIEGINLPDTICEAMALAPDLGPLNA